ncbi:MAG: cupin domain-containing protein [Sedimentisphaerales bacterium]|nr:cupin domain-containing protein [Sedimentisphaerales bacterium]
MSEQAGHAHVLESCLAAPQRLDALVQYANDSIVSKTVLDKPVGTITLFAFDRGQKLSEHTAPYDAVVQVVDGRGQVTIGGQAQEVVAGEIIIMPAHVPHAVDAVERFKMLLTMIRA